MIINKMQTPPLTEYNYLTDTHEQINPLCIET